MSESDDTMGESGEDESSEDEQTRPLTDEQRKQLAENEKQLGNDEYKKGNYSAAVQHYSNAIKQLEEYPDGKEKAPYYGNRAAAYISQQKFKEAVADSERSLELDPSYVKGFLRAAKSYAALGNLDKAIEVIGRVPKQTGAVRKELDRLKQLKEHLAVAKKAIDDGRFTWALPRVRQLAVDLSDSIELNCMVIECLLGNRQYNQAMSMANKLFVQNSENMYLIRLRGVALYYTGQWEKATKHFQSVLRSDPDNRKAMLMFKQIRKLESLKKEGNELFKAGKLKDAISRFTEALSVDRDNGEFNAQLYCNRAAARMAIRDYKPALADCKEAIELKPDYIKAYMRQAACQTAMEDYEEAVRSLEAAKKHDPHNRDLDQKIREAKLELKKSKRKDYYKILGVSKDCDDDDIRKAYKRMAIKWHPDKNRGSEEDTQKAEAMFKDIGEAYNVLSDGQKRRRYDQGADIEDLENGGGHSHGGADMNDMFRMFFQGGGGHSHGFHFG